NQVDIPIQVIFNFQIGITVDDDSVQVHASPQIFKVVEGGVIDLITLRRGDVDLVYMGIVTILGVKFHIGTIHFRQIQVNDIIITTQAQGGVGVVAVVMFNVSINDTDIRAIDILDIVK